MEFGVPFIHDDDIWYPAGFDLFSLQKLGRSSQEESFGATASLVLRMLHATGVVRHSETAGEIYTDYSWESSQKDRPFAHSWVSPYLRSSCAA